MNDDYNELENNPAVEQLFRKLRIPKKIANTIVDNIRDCSILLKDFKSKKSEGTINDIQYRNMFKEEPQRWALRERISNELFNNERLDNDDKIKLGKGGAKPLGRIIQEKEAFIVSGLPASGKSGLCTKLMEEIGAINLDSDYAKRKLPEYYGTIGATIVHKESRAIVLGDDITNSTPPASFKSLLELCAENKYNVVIPIVGDTIDSVLDLHELLLIWGYSISFIHLSIDKYEATRRAIYRFKKSKRYVPIDKIFYKYGDNNPTLTYYKIRVHHQEKFKAFCLLSADVEQGEKFRIEDNINIGFINNIL